MTLLPSGRVADGKLVLDDLRIPLPQRIRAATRNDQTLVLGLRPEAVSLATGNVLPGAIKLQGQVETIQPDYPHRALLLQLCTGRLAYPCLCPMDTPVEVGDTISVQLNSERIYFFDQETGLTL